MTKYILAIDYKATYKPLTIDLEEMEAQSIIDAMKEANKKWHEGVYMMTVYEKYGRARKNEDCPGWTTTDYIPIIERRSSGWMPTEFDPSYMAHVSVEENKSAKLRSVGLNM